ncbi:unnamed protein product, partial [Mesorhabditis belari]|uniref:Uncharacterized protein n=1 Tax=Mesorhabditis belari TaxID=2138241 RepID=A0AAF3FRQ4_9BILA
MVATEIARIDCLFYVKRSHVDRTIDLVRVDSLDSWFGEEGNRSFRKYPQETWLRQNEGEISIEFDGKPGERRWRIENSQRLGVILVITGHLPEDSFLNISSCNSL